MSCEKMLLIASKVMGIQRQTGESRQGVEQTGIACESDSGFHKIDAAA